VVVQAVGHGVAGRCAGKGSAGTGRQAGRRHSAELKHTHRTGEPGQVQVVVGA